MFYNFSASSSKKFHKQSGSRQSLIQHQITQKRYKVAMFTMADQ